MPNMKPNRRVGELIGVALNHRAAIQYAPHHIESLLAQAQAIIDQDHPMADHVADKADDAVLDLSVYDEVATLRAQLLREMNIARIVVAIWLWSRSVDGSAASPDGALGVADKMFARMIDEPEDMAWLLIAQDQF